MFPVNYFQLTSSLRRLVKYDNQLQYNKIPIVTLIYHYFLHISLNNAFITIDILVCLLVTFFMCNISQEDSSNLEPNVVFTQCLTEACKEYLTSIDLRTSSTSRSSVISPEILVRTNLSQIARIISQIAIAMENGEYDFDGTKQPLVSLLNSHLLVIKKYIVRRFFLNLKLVL